MLNRAHNKIVEVCVSKNEILFPMKIFQNILHTAYIEEKYDDHS